VYASSAPNPVTQVVETTTQSSNEPSNTTIALADQSVSEELSDAEEQNTSGEQSVSEEESSCADTKHGLASSPLMLETSE
jgi:hypothetical protein